MAFPGQDDANATAAALTGAAYGLPPSRVRPGRAPEDDEQATLEQERLANQAPGVQAARAQIDAQASRFSDQPVDTKWRGDDTNPGDAERNAQSGAPAQDFSGLDDIVARVNKQHGVGTPMKKPESLGGTFTRHLGESLTSTQQMGHGAVAMAADGLARAGIAPDTMNALRAHSLERYQALGKEQEAQGQDYDSFSNAYKSGDFGQLSHWAAGAFGDAVGFIAQQAAVTVAGGVIGSAVAPGAGTVAGAVGATVDGAAARGIIDKILAGMVSKRIAEIGASDAGKALTEEQVKQLAVRGTLDAFANTGRLAAGTGFNVGLGEGATYGEATGGDKDKQLSGGDFAKAATFGAASGLISEAATMVGLKGVQGELPGMAKLGGMSTPARLAAGTAIGAGVGGAEMGAMGALQDIGAGKDVTAENTLNRVAAGAVMGAGPGALGGIAARQAREKADALQKIFTDRDAVQAALDAAKLSDQHLQELTDATTRLTAPNPLEATAAGLGEPQKLLGYHERDPATGKPYEGEVLGPQSDWNARSEPAPLEPGRPNPLDQDEGRLPAPEPLPQLTFQPPRPFGVENASQRITDAASMSHNESKGAPDNQKAVADRLARAAATGEEQRGIQESLAADQRAAAPRGERETATESLADAAVRGENERSLLRDTYQRNIDKRGGVALPHEARYLDETGAGKAYDRIAEQPAAPVSDVIQLSKARATDNDLSRAVKKERGAGAEPIKITTVERESLPKAAPDSTQLTRNTAGLITQIGRKFGMDVKFYTAEGAQPPEGFVHRGTLYVNATSKTPHLAVFGHEFFHRLNRDSPELGRTFMDAVSKNMAPEDQERFKQSYGWSQADEAHRPGGHVEEMSSDLFGNRMMKPEFWGDVYRKIGEANPDRPGLMARVGALVARMVRHVTRGMEGQGFVAEKWVKDLKAVDDAASTALARYAIERQMPARQMEAERLKAAHDMARLAIKRQSEENPNVESNSSTEAREQPAVESVPRVLRDAEAGVETGSRANPAEVQGRESSEPRVSGRTNGKDAEGVTNEARKDEHPAADRQEPTAEPAADAGRAAEPARVRDERPAEEDVLRASREREDQTGEWRGATRIRGKDGEPLRVFHGTNNEFKRFDATRVGSNPSSALGHWFTLDRGEAARYGAHVLERHLDLRNPKIVKVEDLPAFNNHDEARAYRDGLIKQGYDGLVVSAKHLGGQVNVVAFKHEQIKGTSELRESRERTEDSPEFKRWFGKSKVVDADGKPQVVYHGTDAASDFGSFKRSPRGIFFSDDPAEASSYATGEGVEHARVMPAYLKLENPYEMTPEDVAANRAADMKGFRALRMYQTQLFARAEAAGHDGMKYAGAWVAFDPKDIKSAIGNRGTFDEHSSRITESRPRIDDYSLFQGVERPKRKPSPLGDAMRKVFAPASRGPLATRTAAIMRANFGEMAREQELAVKQLFDTAKQFNKLSQAESVAFIDAMERGDTAHLPLWQRDAAQSLREMLDYKREQVQGLGTGALENFDANYFPHIWKQHDEAQKLFSRRPLEGSKAFLKKRTIPRTTDGLRWRAYDSEGDFIRGFDSEAEAKSAADAAGGGIGKPLDMLTSNPAEMALLKGREMDRYVYGQRVFAEMKDADLARLVMRDQQAPDGWTRIDDKIAKVGAGLKGEYWAPDQAATLLNNHLSPGLQGNGIYDAFRRVGSMMNSMQLGLSAFHVGFTTMDAMVSKVALGVKQVGRGDITDGLASIAQGLNPVQPLINYLKGDKLLKAYMGDLDSPEMAPIVEALQQAGGRVHMDPFYRNAAVNAFKQALKRGDKKDAALELLPTIMDRINAPIFEHLVPRQKLGVFFDMAKDWIGKNPNATLDEKRYELGRMWDSVDNRMGQLVYDNLFWHRALKDGLMATVRSVGWNLGTFRELGGGIKDIAKIGETKQLSDRTAYVIALPMAAALYGAVTQYLYTGEGPDSLMDAFYPRTGATRPDGSLDRVSLPTYMKDVVAYGKDINDFMKYGSNPTQTLQNKLHPMLSTMGQMMSNQDFFGGAIRSPGDPWVQQVQDEASYLEKQLQPFSIRNAQQQAKTQGKELTVGDYLTSPSMIGVTPAPGYVTKDAKQEESAQVSRLRTPVMTKFREALQNGDVTPAEARTRMLAAGLTLPEITQVLHQAARGQQPRPANKMRSFREPQPIEATS